MKNNPYKTTSTKGLPEDEHMMFETCVRHPEWNENINLKSVHFVGFQSSQRYSPG